MTVYEDIKARIAADRAVAEQCPCDETLEGARAEIVGDFLEVPRTSNFAGSRKVGVYRLEIDTENRYPAIYEQPGGWARARVPAGPPLQGPHPHHRRPLARRRRRTPQHPLPLLRGLRVQGHPVAGRRLLCSRRGTHSPTIDRGGAEGVGVE